MALRPSLAEGATLLFLRGQRPCRGAVPGIFGILCALFTSYPSRIIGVADYLCFEPPPFSLHTLLLSADYSPKCNINPTTPSVFECATSSEMSTAHHKTWSSSTPPSAPARAPLRPARTMLYFARLQAAVRPIWVPCHTPAMANGMNEGESVSNPIGPTPADIREEREPQLPAMSSSSSPAILSSSSSPGRRVWCFVSIQPPSSSPHRHDSRREQSDWTKEEERARPHELGAHSFVLRTLDTDVDDQLAGLAATSTSSRHGAGPAQERCVNGTCSLSPVSARARVSRLADSHGMTWSLGHARYILNRRALILTPGLICPSPDTTTSDDGPRTGDTPSALAEWQAEEVEQLKWKWRRRRHGAEDLRTYETVGGARARRDAGVSARATTPRFPPDILPAANPLPLSPSTADTHSPAEETFTNNTNADTSEDQRRIRDLAREKSAQLLMRTFPKPPTLAVKPLRMKVFLKCEKLKLQKVHLKVGQSGHRAEPRASGRSFAHPENDPESRGFNVSGSESEAACILVPKPKNFGTF
ncbi:hypothetical protein C8R43DRAFT_955200 [Mycena crocata]|nr:hypothetical protein C8R43DRAFT_955200 [Mycena crocata]